MCLMKILFPTSCQTGVLAREGRIIKSNSREIKSLKTDRTTRIKHCLKRRCNSYARLGAGIRKLSGTLPPLVVRHPSPRPARTILSALLSMVSFGNAFGIPDLSTSVSTTRPRRACRRRTLRYSHSPRPLGTFPISNGERRWQCNRRQGRRFPQTLPGQT
ncbi:hypothetical protein PDESU_03368 [Pontiella desulfatans]|uniref:Uncharacterized protein n=1 Tax=Pontiella desulfatans TaxID=2750659 RepID=A0A6C2U4P3_PONDE|nr:hypothetical protein PDESU_03368 [Pontiella desulfatans]